MKVCAPHFQRCFEETYTFQVHETWNEDKEFLRKRSAPQVEQEIPQHKFQQQQQQQ